MNLDGTYIDVQLDLEAIVWAVLRLNPEVQIQFISQILYHTDCWSVIEAVNKESHEMLKNGGMLDD